MRISIRKSQRVLERAEQSTTRRHGFVLVEVIVAMVLLAIAVSSLAALVFSVSHSGIRTTGDAYRNGVLMNEVNRLEGLPFDSLSSSSAGVSTGPYAHTRTITVTPLVPDVIKSITVLIVPVNPTYKRDSVTFLRTKARTSRVLCTDCPQG